MIGKTPLLLVILIFGLSAMHVKAAYAARPRPEPTSQTVWQRPAKVPMCTPATRLSRERFSHSTSIDNKWLPIVAGTQLRYEGTTGAGQHEVLITVTDLVKYVSGVRTRVVIEQDFEEGELIENELTFRAQDDNGNVWNFGEYPEDFVGGVFQGAPNTWINGIDDAEAGVEVQGRTSMSNYVQGFAPDIDFLDCAKVDHRQTLLCQQGRCYSDLLVLDEWSPLEDALAHQLKYHASRVGVVRIVPVNDPEGETLVLTEVRTLDTVERAQFNQEARDLDAHGITTNEVYGQTKPISSK